MSLETEKKAGGSEVRLGSALRSLVPEEAEAGLLACVFLDPGPVIEMCKQAEVEPAAFAPGKRRILFTAALAVFSASGGCDPALICEWLKTEDQLGAVGGIGAVFSAQDAAGTTIHANDYLTKVRDAAMQRRLLMHAAELEEKLREPYHTFDECQDAIQPPLSAMVGIQVAAKGKTLHDVWRDGMIDLQARIEGRVDRSRTIHSGLGSFDDRLWPFNPLNEDHVVVIMGEPSAGKSAVARQMIGNMVVAQGLKAAVFLHETQRRNYLQMLSATRAAVNLQKLDEEPADKQIAVAREMAALESAMDTRLFIYDEDWMIDQVEARMEFLTKRVGHIDVMCIDYIQLMQTNKRCRNRLEELTDISTRIKRLAKRLDLLVLNVAQVNRESRKAKGLPQKHDLADCSQIEKDADRIIGIYTPEKDCRGQEQGIDQLIVEEWLCQVKHRNGPLGFAKFWFEKSRTRFVSINPPR